ncbi:hypothetical protein [Cohnella luojiensis]|uniref:Uncharacterized protein n=1 Tax=Cohnella luojiensis TaxID=652876 RepID=A0A4Y8M6I3_9BACL|nr:hypothetical protein [Cohnella luojiensis]TFE31580.1 hypothetical protein E2980_00395 [Cohnella luojiensis]
MKRLRIFAILLSLTIVLVGCDHPDNVNTMPEKMPDDFNFSVRFGITSKNEVNTFDSTVTKDLVVNGTAKATIRLSEKEMTDIYNQMREIDILRDLKLVARSNCYKTPYSEDFWKVQLNAQAVMFDWSDEACEMTENAEKLKQLRQFILDIVKKKPEYKELPEAEGGYD